RANLAFKNVRDRNGVCCFTRDARSLLMWAHYARSHTGICLAFSVADDMGLLSLARPVNYTASFPKLIWPDDKDRVVENVIFHKEEIWRYEREMRLVDRGGPNRSLRMAPKALVGVILGASCSKQTESLVRDMLGERTAKGFPAVRIYQAEPKIDAYGLRVLSA
ncbi:MAG: DUF2971 domain-containing protein, partial [Pseudoxanthomonas sp.]|nr:DUF2971 domain-containing protein [Pseudoxanthomonas sp.]